MELWYKEPASYWEEALPLGNGRLGAMVWSGTAQEKNLIKRGIPCGLVIPRAMIYPERRNTIYRRAGCPWKKKRREAQALLEQNVLGEYTQSYLPLGELTLDMAHPEGEIRNYKRALELEKALSRLEYSAGGD